MPIYIDGNIIEYRALVLTLKESQAQQPSPRPKGRDLHGNNIARSARSPFLSYLLGHPLDNFGETLKVIGHFLIVSTFWRHYKPVLFEKCLCLENR